MRRAGLLSFSVPGLLIAFALGAPLRAQEPSSVVLVGLDPASGALVPIALEIVRRPGEVRLEPATGTLSVVAEAALGSSPALLAFDPAMGALVGVDVVVVRGSGEIRLDPSTGRLSAEGAVAPPGHVPGPILVGYDSTTLSLVPVEIGFVSQAESFALNPRSGTVSPSPRGRALVGFEPASGALRLVEVSPVRGRGGFSVDSGTGRISMNATAQGTGPVTLLGHPSGANSLVAVDLQQVNRGVLAVDPRNGLLVSPGQAPAPGAGAGRLSMLGAHSPTGALTRVDLEAVAMPGDYAVDMSAGAVKPRFAGPEFEAVEPWVFVFGGGLDLREMIDLKDVLAEVGSGATGADATGLAPGGHGSVEVRWKAISLGAEVGYTVLNTEVVFPQGLQTGDLKYLEAGTSLKIHVPLESPISPYATASILWTRIVGNFEINTLSDERTHDALRTGFGGGFDYWATPQWGFRAEALYNTAFEELDAADHVRLRVGAVYSTGRMRDD